MNFNIATEQERPGFPTKHFNDPLFDQTIFAAAREFLKGYQGGHWDCVTTSEGVPFMIPGQDTCILIAPSTKQELEVDNTLAGFILTHIVLTGKIQDGMTTYSQQHYDLRGVIADYCIELDRGDVLKALLH
ncbi:antirestriction protein [Methylobacter sp.]|uniref:antirestriction protein n=1 Tax=Methylobacter sp. TaxID=2051955 RepID=UPI002FDE3FF3